MSLLTLMKTGKEFLGTEYPVICGAMSWVSLPEFCAAVSNAGGLGVYACAHIEPDNIRKDIEKIRRLSKAPVAANIVTISHIFEQQFETLLDLRPAIMVFAAKLPGKKEITAAKDKNIKVMTFAPNLNSARRMIDFGADALIVEGSESGGHIGSVSTLVLLQEILFAVKDKPVFAAGGISSGKMAVHLMLMGAAGVQLGSRFMLSEEAPIHPKIKQALLNAECKDTFVSSGIDRRMGLVSVRSLRNKATDDFLKLQIEMSGQLDRNQLDGKEALEKAEKFWLGALRRAMQDGDVETGSVMAGSAVGLMKEILPVRKIIENLISEAENEINLIKQKMS